MKLQAVPFFERSQSGDGAVTMGTRPTRGGT